MDISAIVVLINLKWDINMRYLILSSTGKPVEEIDNIEDARERIAGTCDVIKYIPEVDDEPSDLCYSSRCAEQVLD